METEIKNEALEQMLPEQDPADKRPSAYSRTIASIDDLLKNIELRDKCKRILGFGHDDLTPDHFYEYEAEEQDEEIVRLLDNLGVLKADWTGFKKQPLGMRKMRIAVDNNSVIDFFDRLDGKKTKISKATLRFVSHQLVDGRDADAFFELLESCGVPKSLFQYDESYPINNEWKIAYDILKLYSSSPNQDDLEVVFQIMEKAAQPIMFGGDEKKSIEFKDQVSGYLQYDGYCFDNGKIAKATDDLLENIKSRQKGEVMTEELRKNKKINLSSQEIIFDDKRAKIIAGKLECQLPPYKNEHFLCREMFHHVPGEFVDWSEVFDKMDSRDHDIFNMDKRDRSKFSRSIHDAMFAVNRRIKEQLNTDDDLFAWKERAIVRNF